MKTEKQYRFFYHYFKQKGVMSVHFRNKCYVTDKVYCWVPCETKWNKRQPRLVMQGFAERIELRENEIWIL
jgi:hypothetical protein